jgi:hypothetical protein
MSRLTGLACAAALLAVTGCSFDSFTLTGSNEEVPKNEQVLGGTPQAVAVSAQTALQQMNIMAKLDSKGDAVQVSGTTKGGQSFVLKFESRKTGLGDSTAVRVEWTKGVDGSFWWDFMGTLATVMESQKNMARTTH